MKTVVRTCDLCKDGTPATTTLKTYEHGLYKGHGAPKAFASFEVCADHLRAAMLGMEKGLDRI